MELTQKQNNVLNFITQFTLNNGYPPTYSEISIDFKITTTTVQDYIEALVRKGYLEKTSGVARGFFVKNKSISEFNKAKGNVKFIPIVGTVAAGSPIFAYENVQGYISCVNNKWKQNNLFALKVIGDSMVDVNIMEGDIVIIKKQPHAENGEVVIALKDNEATLKILRRRNDKVYLEAANKERKYPNIEGPFNIIGKVVELRRGKISF